MTFQNIINVLFGLALAVIIWLVLRQKPGNSFTTNTTIEYDSSTTVVKPYTHTETTNWIKDTIRVPVPQDVDTAAILRDYYTKKVSVQEYRDSSLYAKISDTLFLNSIASRSFEYKILRPSTITNVLPTPKLQLYAGTTISAQVTGITATGIINGRYMVSAGYDLRGKQPFFSAGIKILPLKIK